MALSFAFRRTNSLREGLLFPVLLLCKKKFSTRKMPGSITESPMKQEAIQHSPLKKPKLNLSTSLGSKPVLRICKMTENAYTPTRGSNLAAGYDLYSAYDCVVPSKGKALVKTDIQIELPSGCYGRVAPRSGLAHKNFIDVGAGVIDEDYRGNVGVILFNFGDEEFKVSKGDRIAQLICERIFYPDIEEVQELSSTDRGAGGYGSTVFKGQFSDTTAQDDTVMLNELNLSVKDKLSTQLRELKHDVSYII